MIGRPAANASATHAPLAARVLRALAHARNGFPRFVPPFRMLLRSVLATLVAVGDVCRCCGLSSEPPDVFPAVYLLHLGTGAGALFHWLPLQRAVPDDRLPWNGHAHRCFAGIRPLHCLSARPRAVNGAAALHAVKVSFWNRGTHVELASGVDCLSISGVVCRRRSRQ